jgi:hypothetical protein
LLQELIVLEQVHIDDRHVGHHRQPTSLAYQAGHGFAAKRLLAVEQEPQGFVDPALALARRELEDLQVFLDRAAGPLVLQGVVGHAEPAGGEHRVAVAVFLERAGLAHQPVDDVAVVDPVLATATKPRQAIDLLGAVPDVETIDPDVHIDFFADQTTGQRIDVATDVDRAPGIDFRRDPPGHLDAPRWQGGERGLILGEAVAAVGVASGHDLPEERLVFAAAGEIAASPQHQGLVDGLLEPVVALLGVAVLVGFAGLDRLGLDAIMPEQSLIALCEHLGFDGGGVDGGAHAVGAMPPGSASQLPQGVLQPFAQALETFAEANRAVLPVGVGEHEVIDEVVERLAGDRDAEFGHVGEVGRGELPWLVVLCEEHLLGRPFQGAPAFDSPLKAAELTVGKASWKASLEVEEQGLGLKSGIEAKLGFEFGPDVAERVGTSSPVARRAALAGELVRVAVLPCRFLVDPRLVGGPGQGRFRLEHLPQPPELPIGEHPFAPESLEPKRDSLPTFKGREF